MVKFSIKFIIKKKIIIIIIVIITLFFMRANRWGYFMRFYHMEESVLLQTKPLVDSISHFIRDSSGVFSVCHLCECRIVQ